MTAALHRRALLHAGVAVGLAAAGLPARACEFYATTLRITHPWTRATADDASAAIVCMKFDEVLQDDRLIGVRTDIAASAELVRVATRNAGRRNSAGAIDLAIHKGRETVLSEAGTHLRLLGLRQPLDVDRVYPITLVFALGGVVRADLSVDYAGLR